MIKKAVLISLLSIFFAPAAFSQDEWIVPETDKENISIYVFDEDFALEGQIIYENSCTSCHGNPEQADFSIMIPSPNDIASEGFQNQNDGELFYKIKNGRGAMPGFDEAFSSEEIWYLVAFIRSFNAKYEQAITNLEGIEIVKYSLTFDFDENVNKLVVKVSNEEEIPVEEVEVSAFIKSLFGKFSLGKTSTNKLGIAYFDIDSKIPGDSAGYLNIIAKASKGYSSGKKTKKMQIANPAKSKSAIAGRHLWSVGKSAPIWLIVTFLLTIIGVWGTIFFVLIGLRKIRKLG